MVVRMIVGTTHRHDHRHRNRRGCRPDIMVVAKTRRRGPHLVHPRVPASSDVGEVGALVVDVARKTDAGLGHWDGNERSEDEGRMRAGVWGEGGGG